MSRQSSLWPRHFITAMDDREPSASGMRRVAADGKLRQSQGKELAQASTLGDRPRCDATGHPGRRRAFGVVRSLRRPGTPMEEFWKLLSPDHLQSRWESLRHWSLDGKPLLWDFKTMTLLSPLEREPYKPGSVQRNSVAMAFSPEGRDSPLHGPRISIRSEGPRHARRRVGRQFGRRLGETKATGSRIRALASRRGAICARRSEETMRF